MRASATPAVVAIALALRDHHDVTTYAARCGAVCWTLHFNAVAAVSAVNCRLISRLLLAFALLWSQQAVLSHTVSHLVQANRAKADAPGKPVKSLLTDQSCAECLAHAQFFSALGSAPRSLATSKPVMRPIVVLATPDDCIVTVCVFQPRAPPQA